MVNTDEIERKLSAACTWLIIDKPFLGALVLRLPLVAADPKWCPTTATDVRALYYNPDYIGALDLEQTKFALAHEVAGGRWVATGGGGYQWASVVPRAWTIYFAQMCDVELPDALPESWIEQVEFEIRREVPTRFSEPVMEPDVLDPRTEAVIRSVREVCFPFFGLRP